MQIASEAQINQLLRSIEIPPCPAVLSELTGEMRREDVSTDRISHLIASDVALAAGVLKTANSPLLGLGRRVGSIRDAVNLLGLKNLFGLVINELLRKSLLAGNASCELEAFWDHTLYGSLVCRRAAASLRLLDPEVAYTFSLFRDCGIPLLMRRVPGYLSQIRSPEVRDDPAYVSMTGAEDQRFGTNHAVIGYLISRGWGLSDSVCQAILVHHDCFAVAQAGDLSEESRTLVALSLMTERVLDKYFQSGGDGHWPVRRGCIAEYLGFTSAEVEDTVQDLLEWISVVISDQPTSRLN